MAKQLVQPTKAEMDSRQRLQEARSAQALMVNRLCMATAGMAAVGVVAAVAAFSASSWFATASIVIGAGEFFRVGREQIKVYSARVDDAVEEAQVHLAQVTS